MDLQSSYQIYFNESMALSHASFFAMHTRMEILLCDIKRTEAEFAFGQIYRETIRVEQMLNRFDPHSEVSGINSSSDSIQVSSELCCILAQCLQFNQLTCHLFDVCINAAHPKAPGIANFVLDFEKSAVRPTNGRLNFDFGAYAKGYVLDRIKNILQALSVKNALINFGNSSILALGRHPHGNCWKVSLQHSFNPSMAVHTFDLFNEVLTTSGLLPDKKPHIRSPFSGELKTEKATYSVVTKTGVEGEAISTALYAANDLAQQKAILENFKVEKATKVAYGDDCKTFQVLQT